MKFTSTSRRSLSVAIAFALAASIAGCGSKEPPPQATGGNSTAGCRGAGRAAIGGPAVQQAAAQAPTSWSAEALEDLLAPIALYPDPVLSQVLMASANPQEVLDAGNWILENQSLKGKALDDAAAADRLHAAGPRAAAVPGHARHDVPRTRLDHRARRSVHRRPGRRTRRRAAPAQAGEGRRQPAELAADDGRHADSRPARRSSCSSRRPARTRSTCRSTIRSPSMRRLRPRPRSLRRRRTDHDHDDRDEERLQHRRDGHDGPAVVRRGHARQRTLRRRRRYYKYKYPNYGYGGMPYYPPYPYRPAYGNGYYPSNGYRPPRGYGGGFHNSGNIIVTNPGGGRRQRLLGPVRQQPGGRRQQE